MYHGIYVTREAKSQMKKDRFGQFYFSDFVTTGGIILQLDDMYANAPVKSGKTPFRLVYDETEKMLLARDGINFSHKIKVFPTPRFALEVQLLDGRIPIRDLVMVHGDRARISPIHGCYFNCHFCSTSRRDYKKIDLTLLDRAFQEASNDSYASFSHALISGGTPRENEADYDYMDQVYSHFPHKYTNIPWDVMLAPRAKKPNVHNRQEYQEYLKFLKESGISTLSVNLELFNTDKSKTYMEGKHLIGQENYIIFIEEAVRVLGNGKVRSSLIVGLENKEDTISGVKTLCEIGCIPVLSPFVPDARTNLAQYDKPTPENLLDILIEAEAITKIYDTELGPHCQPCKHNCINIEDSQEK
jgi:hypothetical protein